MRISDWSSDVCSSDLLKTPPPSRESYDAAVEWVKNLGHKLDAIFETYDAILSPTLPVTAPILPEGLADPYPTFCCGTYYTAIANLLMLPALSFPAGLVDGMPVGLQIMGRYGREDQILRRSEEHTSELQSLMRISYAVFCLKKKKENIKTTKRETYKQN